MGRIKEYWGNWEAMSEVILTKEHLADLWKKIATEFKDYKNIWGYDLMNEPKGIDINVFLMIIRLLSMQFAK